MVLRARVRVARNDIYLVIQSLLLLLFAIPRALGAQLQLSAHGDVSPAVRKRCTAPPWYASIAAEIEAQQHPNATECASSTLFTLAGEAENATFAPPLRPARGRGGPKVTDIQPEEGWGSTLNQIACALLVSSSAAATPRRTLVVDASRFSFGSARPDCDGIRGLECIFTPLSTCSYEDVVAAAAADPPPRAGASSRAVLRHHRAARYMNRYYLRVDAEGKSIPVSLRPLPPSVTPWQYLSAYRAYLHAHMSPDAAAAVASLLRNSDGEDVGSWFPARSICPPPIIGVHIRFGDGSTSEDNSLASHARMAVRAGADTGGRRVVLATDVDDPRMASRFEAALSRAAAEAGDAARGTYCVRTVPRLFVMPSNVRTSVAAFLSSDAGAPFRWNASIDALAVVEALSNSAAIVGNQVSQLLHLAASVAAAKGCAPARPYVYSVVGRMMDLMKHARGLPMDYDFDAPLSDDELVEPASKYCIDRFEW